MEYKSWNKLVELAKEYENKQFEITFDKFFEIIKLNWDNQPQTEPKVTVIEPNKTIIITNFKRTPDNEIREYLYKKLGEKVMIVPTTEFYELFCKLIYVKFEFIGCYGKESYINPKLLED